MAVKFRCKLKRNSIGYYNFSLSSCNFDSGNREAWITRTHKATGDLDRTMRYLSDRLGTTGRLRFRNVKWNVAERYCPLARWCLCPMTRQKAWRPLRLGEARRNDSGRIGRRTFRREQPWGAGRSHRHSRLNPPRTAPRRPGGWRD